MRKALCIILIGFLIYSCGQKKSTENKYVINPIEKEINDTPIIEEKGGLNLEISTTSEILDTIPIHVFKSGDILWDLGRSYYGNRHYSSIIATYNEIEDVRNIENGSPIKLLPAVSR